MDYTSRAGDEIIARACHVLESRMRHAYESTEITSPDRAATFLKLRLATREREVFAALFLDVRRRLIRYEELFLGTVDAAAVYPREIAKAALRHNASAIVIAHNHPSGQVEPSEADKVLTRRIKDALALVDVQLLDHIVVGAETQSLAELGLV